MHVAARQICIQVSTLVKSLQPDKGFFRERLSSGCMSCPVLYDPERIFLSGRSLRTG